MKELALKYDICVIGAGPAGLCASIAASRQGKKVLVVDKNGYLGGNCALGLPLLGFLDLNGKQVIAGMAQEWVDRLTARGMCEGHRVCPKHNSVTCFHSETFKLVAIDWLREEKVDVLLHLEACDTKVEDGRLKKVTFYGKGNRVQVEADMFMDCTGDGDVAYLAGAEYGMGQEATGILQPPTVMCTVEGVDTAKLFDHIEKHPDEMTYSATIDHRPGYDAPYFRASKNHVFVGLRSTFTRLRAEGKLPVERETLIYIKSPNPGEIYINSTRLLRTDATDIVSLTNAELEGQRQVGELVKMLREEVPGFENAFISAIQPNLGVRETRRISCRDTVRAEQAVAGEIPADTVALNAYKIDIHSGVDRSTIFSTIKEAYGMPYGCLVPKGINGLMVAGRSVGVDAKVMASSRIMPVCMALGEAAGYAAAQALDKGIEAYEVDVQQVREKILENNGILERP